MSLFKKSKKPNRIWAITEDGSWARWAPDLNCWEIYSEKRQFIFADPTTDQACYYINLYGSVHWRNVDKDKTISFPGIVATAISVGGNNRLWAIRENGCWARWAPDLGNWEYYPEKRRFIFADPTTEEACYYIDEEGTVFWRNIDKNDDKIFPGINAKMITVSGDNRLWAIQENGQWARWAPDLERWEVYSEKRRFIFGSPESGSTCYYVNKNGTVHWRNIHKDMERKYPGITATMVSVGGK